MFYLVKMEYASKNSKINILGLNMTVKSGLEKNILKYLHAQNYLSYIIKLPKIENWISKWPSFCMQEFHKKKCVVYVH